MNGKSRDGRKAWPLRGLALGLAGVALSLTAAAGSEVSQDTWQGRSDGSPVYWGGERSPRTYRDCCGFAWTRLNPAQASIRQVNPHLRAVSDGRLLEEVGGPPPAPEAFDVWPYSYGPAVTYIPPRFFHWHGFRRGYRFMRGRR
jgi:hypothetical protein